MTCTRIGNGYMCHSAPSFEFRFFIWKCEFTNSMMGGPYWTISVPYFSFKDFWYTTKVWRDPWDWKFYTGMTEIYYSPGEHSLLWRIFQKHYDKWMHKSRMEIENDKTNV